MCLSLCFKWDQILFTIILCWIWRCKAIKKQLFSLWHISVDECDYTFFFSVGFLPPGIVVRIINVPETQNLYMEESGVFWAQEALWVSTLDFLSRTVHNSRTWGKIRLGVYVPLEEMQHFLCFGCWETNRTSQFFLMKFTSGWILRTRHVLVSFGLPL